MRPKHGFALVLAVAIALLAGAGSAIGAPLTLIVDDTVGVGACPGATFTTIQAAVTAALPGDTIHVCPGTYASANITKSITIDGSTSGVTHSGTVDGSHCFNRLLFADPTVDSIVNGGAAPGPAGLTISANNVTVQGLTLQSASGDAGINVPQGGPGTSGLTVRWNVVQDNTIGIFLNSNGVSHSSVFQNCIRDNNVAGSSSETGIYSDAGLKNADITENFITGHGGDGSTPGAGVSVNLTDTTPGNQSGITIKGNRILQDGEIRFSNVTGSTISGNTITDSHNNGIEFANGNSGDSALNNTITRSAYSGIQVFGVGANTISGNDVSFSADGGIRLRNGATGNTVTNNSSSENGTFGYPLTGDGFTVEGTSTVNTLTGNIATDNRRDGFFVDAGSTGNTLKKNKASGSSEFDCRDDNTGGGPTAGTGNIWKKDIGKTRKPTGICKTGKPPVNSQP